MDKAELERLVTLETEVKGMKESMSKVVESVDNLGSKMDKKFDEVLKEMKDMPSNDTCSGVQSRCAKEFQDVWTAVGDVRENTINKNTAALITILCAIIALLGGLLVSGL